MTELLKKFKPESHRLLIGERKDLSVLEKGTSSEAGSSRWQGLKPEVAESFLKFGKGRHLYKGPEPMEVQEYINFPYEDVTVDSILARVNPADIKSVNGNLLSFNESPAEVLDEKPSETLLLIRTNRWVDAEGDNVWLGVSYEEGSGEILVSDQVADLVETALIAGRSFHRNAIHYISS